MTVTATTPMSFTQNQAQAAGPEPICYRVLQEMLADQIDALDVTQRQYLMQDPMQMDIWVHEIFGNYDDYIPNTFDNNKESLHIDLVGLAMDLIQHTLDDDTFVSEFENLTTLLYERLEYVSCLSYEDFMNIVHNEDLIKEQVRIVFRDLSVYLPCQAEVVIVEEDELLCRLCHMGIMWVRNKNNDPAFHMARLHVDQ